MIKSLIFIFVIFFISWEYSFCNENNNFLFTDNIYLDLLKSSSEFKNIDNILNNNFKLALKKLSDNEKINFIEWQKNWIDEDRSINIKNCISKGKTLEWCAVQDAKSRNDIILSFMTGKELIGYPFIRPDRDYENYFQYGNFDSLNVTDNYESFMFSSVDVYFDNKTDNKFKEIWELAEKNNYPISIKGKMILTKNNHSKLTMVIGDGSDVEILLNKNGKLYSANKYNSDIVINKNYTKKYSNSYFSVDLVNGWELLNSEDSKLGFRYDFINRKYGCGVSIVFCNNLFNPVDTLIKLSNAISSECEVPFTYPKEVEKSVYFTISDGSNKKFYLFMNNNNDKSIIFTITGKFKEAIAMDMIFLNDIKFNIDSYLPNYLRGY